MFCAIRISQDVPSLCSRAQIIFEAIQKKLRYLRGMVDILHRAYTCERGLCQNISESWGTMAMHGLHFAVDCMQLDMAGAHSAVPGLIWPCDRRQSVVPVL